MWEYVILILSSILAIIGATLNSENSDNKKKKKTLFKKPNNVGWFVIALLVLSAFAQFIAKIVQENKESQKQLIAEKRRAVDSINFEKSKVIDSVNYKMLQLKSRIDSQAFKRQFDLLDTSYHKQIQNLLIGYTILAGTNKLNHPILPMVAMFNIKVPFHNPWLSSYVKRILLIKKTLENKGSYSDIGCIDEFRSNEFSQKEKSQEYKIFGFYADTCSEFYIKEQLDEFSACRFLDPKFDIKIFDKKPSGEMFEQCDLFLGAENKIQHPWPQSAFTEHNFYVNFVDSFISLSIFYQIDNYPNKAKIIGVQDLYNKYLAISCEMPVLDFSITSICFFTGPNFCRYIKIKLSDNDDKSTRYSHGEKIGYPLDYLHKVTDSDLK